MLCSDCPLKDDNNVSDRVLITVAVPQKLYSWLLDECDKLAELGYSDRGYRPTPPALLLHSLAKYADSELTRSPLNVRHDLNKEFTHLKLFSNVH